MNFYHSYASINQKLVSGVSLHYGEGEASILPSDPRLLRIPRIGVYAGSGTSHSWLWFVELFDRMLFHDLVFLTEDMVKEGVLQDLDVFVMSGGDTVRIAEGLGRQGAGELESFIRGGGLYLGSCAGAYLPLKSSKQYLDRFNFVDIKIANVSKTRPEAKRLESKAITTYGCNYVYHPVREDVRLWITGREPFTSVESLRAPLYGGPSMVTVRDSDVLAYYQGFTEKTLFLVDESLAEKTLVGKVAAARTAMGDGHLYLFGPHFEHPRFPTANHLVATAIFWDMKRETINRKSSDGEIILEGTAKKKLILDIKREISNARIVSVGLEAIPVKWIIGCKTYEPEKIRVFLEAMWKRINRLERSRRICLQSGTGEQVVAHACQVRQILREMKSRIDDHLDTQDLAVDLFNALRRLTMLFLQFYFNSFAYNLELDS
ncbi:MAG: BPL-N domain-containing protein [Deltaproteobacteria bacterium]|nr:BPL-N domain-containing protein [Deltaproteobacteria bacterium]